MGFSIGLSAVLEGSYNHSCVVHGCIIPQVFRNNNKQTNKQATLFILEVEVPIEVLEINHTFILKGKISDLS